MGTRRGGNRGRRAIVARVHEWRLKSDAAFAVGFIGGSLTDCAHPANKWEAMISLPPFLRGIHSVEEHYGQSSRALL